MMKELAVLSAVASSAMASAQIVWDQGPGTGVIWEGEIPNVESSLNLVDSVRFTQDTLVNRYVHYTISNRTDADYNFRVYADANGQPGALLSSQMIGPPSVATLVGHDHLHNDPVYEEAMDFVLNPLTFSANTTYWVGASIDSAFVNFGYATTIRSPGDGRVAVMNGTTFQNFASDQDSRGGDLMFRLGTVSEPGAIIPLAVGAGLVVARKRKKK